MRTSLNQKAEFQHHILINSSIHMTSLFLFVVIFEYECGERRETKRWKDLQICTLTEICFLLDKTHTHTYKKNTTFIEQLFQIIYILNSVLC